MSCAFSGIQRENRQYPLNQPDGWKVKYPRWTLQLPALVDGISITYIGIQPSRSIDLGTTTPNIHSHVVTEAQKRATSLVEAWILTGSNKYHPEEWEKFYVESGYDTLDTEVYVLYWADRNIAQSALEGINLEDLIQSLSPEFAANIGVWIESFTVPKARFETTYSGNDYRPGIAALKGSSQLPHTFTGYWGAARDRIPASSDDTFEPRSMGRTPILTKDTRHRIIKGHNQDILLHIRSGQYWQGCVKDERQAYETSLEPVLREGMAYLEENAGEVGNFGLRFMRNIISNRRIRRQEIANHNMTFTDESETADLKEHGHMEKRQETCVAGFFRSLRDIECWAANHRTHQKIFHGIHAHSLQFGREKSKVRTWHEVSVLQPGEVYFEYVNCHPRTGLLPFIQTD